MLSHWRMPGCEGRSEPSKCLKEELYDLYILYCIVFLTQDYVNRCEKNVLFVGKKKCSAILNTDSVCLLVFSWDLSHTFCCKCVCAWAPKHTCTHQQVHWGPFFPLLKSVKKEKRKRGRGGEWTEKERHMGVLSLPINQCWREILKALAIACTMFSP